MSLVLAGLGSACRSAAWQDYLGGADDVDDALVAHREVIKQYTGWR